MFLLPTASEQFLAPPSKRPPPRAGGVMVCGERCCHLPLNCPSALDLTLLLANRPAGELRRHQDLADQAAGIRWPQRVFLTRGGPPRHPERRLDLHSPGSRREPLTRAPASRLSHAHQSGGSSGPGICRSAFRDGRRGGAAWWRGGRVRGRRLRRCCSRSHRSCR